ncbi:MAG: CRTAC1 family protein, partial [Flavobacteriales bacterium]
MKPLSFRFRHMLISVCLLCAGIVCITEQSTAQGFTNVAPGVGITTTFGNVTYGGGVSCADFNEDGFDDLTLTTGTGSEVAFYINDSTGGFNGPFNYITNTYEKKQPLWVDYDNDGDLDFYVTTNNTNRLYRNDGNYVLTDVTASCGISEGVSNSFNSVWFDYDEDGFLDLVMSHRFSFLVGNLSLYHNLGDGTFEDLTIAAGLNNMGNSVLAMATLDYDNDGWEDLFVAQDFEVACLLLHNNGDGTFTNTAVSAGAAILNDSMTCTVGDFDNNGYMDVYLTDTAQNGNSLLVNQGDGTFVDMAEEKGVFVDLFTWGASFLDADCDMDLDLHINRTSGSPYSGLMYENLNQGEVFQLVSATWGFGSETGKGNGNAVGDYDNDGYPDLAKNNTLNTPGALWRNDFSENNFLKVKLTGTVSNRMAIGSVIHLYAGGVHQMRRVGCGEGFSSQHSYTQLFGLGENETADSIMVSWTNGMLTILYDVQANQLLELIENPLAGCMDEAACNYDPQVITDGENCIYAQPYYDCFFQCIADTDDDDVCDELEVAGCTDNAACNYNPLASDEDNSCEYASCFGCTDSNANNYDPTALFDNGTCTFVCVTYTFILSTDCWSSETSWVVYNPFGDVAYSSDE